MAGLGGRGAGRGQSKRPLSVGQSSCANRHADRQHAREATAGRGAVQPRRLHYEARVMDSWSQFCEDPLVVPARLLVQLGSGDGRPAPGGGSPGWALRTGGGQVSGPSGTPAASLQAQSDRSGGTWGRGDVGEELKLLLAVADGAGGVGGEDSGHQRRADQRVRLDALAPGARGVDGDQAVLAGGAGEDVVAGRVWKLVGSGGSAGQMRAGPATGSAGAGEPGCTAAAGMQGARATLRKASKAPVRMAPGCAPGVEERLLLCPALQRLEALLCRIRLLRIGGTVCDLSDGHRLFRGLVQLLDSCCWQLQRVISAPASAGSTCASRPSHQVQPCRACLTTAAQLAPPAQLAGRVRTRCSGWGPCRCGCFHRQTVQSMPFAFMHPPAPAGARFHASARQPLDTMPDAGGEDARQVQPTSGRRVRWPTAALL
jgi:hypothetical protein